MKAGLFDCPCGLLLLVAFLGAGAAPSHGGDLPQINVEDIVRLVEVDPKWAIENPQDPEDTDNTDDINVTSTTTGAFDESVVSDDNIAFAEAEQHTLVGDYSIDGTGFARAVLEAVPHEGQAEALSAIGQILFTVPVEVDFVLKGSFDIIGTGDPGTTAGRVTLLGTAPNGLFTHNVFSDTPAKDRSFEYHGTAPANGLIILGLSALAQLVVDPDLELDQRGDQRIEFEFQLAFSDVQLAGLEVVQVVQDWRNQIPLVQGRRTIVRAHLESEEPQSVRPLLHGFRNDIELEHSPLMARNPEGSIIPPGDAQDKRGQLGDNAYFRLPTDWTGDGELELYVKLGNEELVFGCAERAGPIAGDCRVKVEFTEISPLNLDYVSIGWTDGGGVEHSPRIESIYGISSGFHASFPIRGFVRRYTSVRMGGSASPTDSEALAAVIQKQIADGCNADCTRFYYGVAVDVPWGGRAAGIGTGRSAVASSGLGTMAHEIGHLLGRPHPTNPNVGPGNLMSANGTPLELGACCSVAEDPDFPSDLFEDVGASDEACPNRGNGVVATSQGRRPTLGEMDDGADLLVYGFHRGLHRVVDPKEAFDLMSYCLGDPAPWPSRHTYEELFQSLQSLQASSTQGFTAPADHLIVFGIVDFAQQTAVIDQVHFAAGIAGPTGSPGSYTLRTLDSVNSEISTVSFEPTMDILVDGDDPNAGSFVVYVPDNPAIRAIEIEHKGVVVASRQASDNAPTVEVLSPNGGETLVDETLQISWTANDVDGDPLQAVVQHSSDGGVTWRTLAVRYSGESLEVSRSEVIGSAAGMIRVQVSDGFLHASDESNGLFSVKDNPPVVTIASPVGNPYFWSGQIVGFDAIAFDQEDGTLTGASLQWSSNIDGPLGIGESLEVPATTLTTGKHTITLRGTDSASNTTSIETSLWIDVDVEVGIEIFSDGFETGEPPAL